MKTQLKFELLSEDFRRMNSKEVESLIGEQAKKMLETRYGLSQETKECLNFIAIRSPEYLDYVVNQCFDKKYHEKKLFHDISLLENESPIVRMWLQ